MQSNHRWQLTALPVVALAFALAGCGGGGGGSTGTSSGSNGNGSTGGTGGTSGTGGTVTATPGVYKGTITSTTSGQTTSVMAMGLADGIMAWMATDGRVWHGTVPATGTHFQSVFMGDTYSGLNFPDGMHHGSWSMTVDRTATHMGGSFAGDGDAGTFDFMRNAMGDRPASLADLAGTYTRSSSTGYTMTMTIDASGHLSATDTLGCRLDGQVTVPDATHNQFVVDATTTGCGVPDGAYHGMGTLVDADAMHDWMSSMHTIEQGHHAHATGMGGGMMGGGTMMGMNTVPSGTHNLFMFAIANDADAIMDALAR